MKHHAGALQPQEITAVDGLAVTVPARALVDAARYTSFEAAVVTTDAALHGTMTTPAELGNALDRSIDWPANRRAVRAVEFADGRAESVGESRGRVAFRLVGLPIPELQVDLYDGAGRFIARVDFYFRAQRTVGEFDGRVKYGRSLLADADPTDILWQEKLREDALRAAGQQVARFIWPELETPQVIDRRFRAAFDRASASTSRPGGH